MLIFILTYFFGPTIGKWLVENMSFYIDWASHYENRTIPTLDSFKHIQDGDAVVLVSVFFVLNIMFYMLSHYVLKFVFPKLFEALKEKNRVDWCCRVVSSINALVSCFGGAYCFFYEILPSDHFVESSYSSVLLAVSYLAGYITYDFLLILYHFSVLADTPTVLHHFAVMGAVLYMLTSKHYQGVAMWLLLNESSTIFLNLRWFLLKINEALDKFGRPLYFYVPPIAFTINAGLFYLFFFLSRVLGDSYLLYLFYANTGFLPLADRVPGLAILTSLCLLNVFWFYEINRFLVRGERRKAHTE
eukprot:GCRY01001347.1.p1 GENE.GCRY01001347.1~~GCRY01001347.1.p1  ORF type:complete len:302 (+),score=29.76 GCRY01001347.1:80-985(+)